MLLSKVIPGEPKLAPNSNQLDEVLRQRPMVFETMTPLTLFAEHNEIPFYTWGDERCCLPKGATRATLHGHFPNLRSGDVLVFDEVINPRTGDADDADRTRRHAVRLTDVRAFADGGAPLTDLLNGRGDYRDRVGPGGLASVSVLRLCDHGPRARRERGERRERSVGQHRARGSRRTVLGEKLGVSPGIQSAPASEESDRCSALTQIVVPPRFRPSLQKLPRHAGRSIRCNPAGCRRDVLASGGCNLGDPIGKRRSR